MSVIIIIIIWIMIWKILEIILIILFDLFLFRIKSALFLSKQLCFIADLEECY